MGLAVIGRPFRGEGPYRGRYAEFPFKLLRQRQRRGFSPSQQLMTVGLAYAEALEIGGLDVRSNFHASQGMPFPYLSSSEKVCCGRNDKPRRLAHNVWMDHNHLRAWRKFRHLTLDEVADAIGSTKATVQQLEVGRMTLSHKWLVKIAPVLGTTPGMLLDHDPNDLPTSVLETWAAIPTEDQPKALEMLKVFSRTGTDG